MKKQGKLIIIAGPSGVGKGTVRSEILKNKSLDFAFSISYTSRLPRKGETDGVDYFFVKEKEFLSLIKDNEFIEYNKYVGNYYGTSRTQINNLRKKGKNIILEIDVNGTRNVMSQFDKSEIISFFILPPSLKELEKRIRLRSTENNLTIINRLKRAKEELKLKKYFNYQIINDDPKRAAKEIINILKSEIK